MNSKWYGHLSSGLRNRAIAHELALSENTVKFHVARIFRALEVTTRAEATSVYLETQLVVR
ncbi:LuxR C-terminal-related transcriptional regulator [Leucobacter luti]|uniref:response regulator transcription factor n=1 Tax=Leucobacter luti TaxID=340320 RepID=UPI00105E79EA